MFLVQRLNGPDIFLKMLHGLAKIRCGVVFFFNYYRVFDQALGATGFNRCFDKRRVGFTVLLIFLGLLFYFSDFIGLFTTNDGVATGRRTGNAAGAGDSKKPNRRKGIKKKHTRKGNKTRRWIGRRIDSIEKEKEEREAKQKQKENREKEKKRKSKRRRNGMKWTIEKSKERRKDDNEKNEEETRRALRNRRLRDAPPVCRQNSNFLLFQSIAGEMNHSSFGSRFHFVSLKRKTK